MTKPHEIPKVIEIGVAIEADAAFEKWHETLLSALNALQGVRVVSLELDAAHRPAPFDQWLAAAAYKIDSLLMSGPNEAQHANWRSSPHSLPAPRAGQHLDILLDLRADPSFARHHVRETGEVWSFNFMRGPSSPEHFGMRQALNGGGAFSVTLDQVSGNACKTLDEAVCASRRSAARNLEQAHQVAIAMILRTLKSRLIGRHDSLNQAVFSSSVESSKLGNGIEGSSDTLRFASGFVSYAAIRGADNLSKRISAWSGTLSPHFRLYRAHGSPLDFQPAGADALSISRQHYLADPFLLSHDGKLWAFFEVFDYHDDTGSIGVAELTASGLGPIQIVLSGDGHLSYPHVFCHDGEVYMMPETCARRRIEIWRAVKFPFEWELAATALDGFVAVDSNLFHDGDRWWLMTNATSDSASDAGLELSIYQSDGPLLHHLTPHRLNPVVADARYSRNGGRIFSRNGRWFRPAQSLEYGTYGYGLYIMEILRLGLDEHQERPVRFIRGCHHIDTSGDDIIFDMKRGISLKDSER